MKVAVLGAGNIGGTLGRKWVQAGHSVKFGVRDAGKPEVKALLEQLGPKASVGTTAEAIAFGDVVVFALPGGAMDETIATHAQALNGKIVVDAANRMAGGPVNSMASFAAHAPGAQVYRAFSNLGWENFANPKFGGVQADLLYCGAAGQSRAIIEKLINDVGLRPVYLGDLSKVGLVDSVLWLWLELVRGQGMERHMAFKVLKD